MYIYNIQCGYTEYRRYNNKWKLFQLAETTVDSNFIENMLEAGQYFVDMGGTQEVHSKKNRRFGVQVISITCISFCGSIRKEFVFNYNNAKHIA